MPKRNTLKGDYALMLWRQGHSPRQAARLAGVAVSTVYRAIERERKKSATAKKFWEKAAPKGD